MLLAQLSDLHITAPATLAYGRVDTAAAYLTRVIDVLSALDPRPDDVLVTGDLTDDAGGINEYRHLRALLERLKLPWHLLVGNHDDRTNLRAAFSGRAELGRDGFVQYAFDAGEVLRIITLDTLEAGASAERLCASRRAWLEAQLDASRDRPVLIGMHHPPFDCGIGFMDAIRLAPDHSHALDALLRRHSNVARIVCGQCASIGRSSRASRYDRVVRTVDDASGCVRSETWRARCLRDGAARVRAASVAQGNRHCHSTA